jgi:hypothetical protein
VHGVSRRNISGSDACGPLDVNPDYPVGMGYRVNTALTVGHYDGHVSFLYYVPSFGTEFEWINQWMDKNFDLIAQEIGPTAVIVAPHANTRDEYRHSLRDAIHWRELENVSGLDDLKPALVVSRRPLRAGDVPDAAVIDLSLAPSINVIARLMDGLTVALRAKQDLQEQLPIILRKIPELVEPHGDHRLSRLVRFLELKPNFFGVGININEIAETFRRRRRTVE